MDSDQLVTVLVSDVSGEMLFAVWESPFALGRSTCENCPIDGDFLTTGIQFQVAGDEGDGERDQFSLLIAPGHFFQHFSDSDDFHLDKNPGLRVRAKGQGKGVK